MIGITLGIGRNRPLFSSRELTFFGAADKGKTNNEVCASGDKLLVGAVDAVPLIFIKIPILVKITNTNTS